MVEENDAGPAGDEPVAEVTGHAGIAEAIEGLADEAFGGSFFEFEGGGVGVVGADEEIAVLPFFYHGGGFGAEDGVDAAELPADFPADFE